tara:strand:- start:1856 stop:2188 length:333 start_codon:yes stop_codon:yes gene_type:complete
MNNILSTLLLISTLALSLNTYGQSKVKYSAKQATTQKLDPAKIESIKKEIKQIEGHIQAIETKKAFILANAEKTAAAKESHWFESMETIKIDLNVKKTRLLNMINSSENE